MISVQNLSLYFGGQDVLRNISFMINKGDRIGLVGKNGAGKSTLLKLLSGVISPNDGTISIPSKLVIGYLKQDIEFDNSKTVIEEAFTAFEKLNKLEKELGELQSQLEMRTDYDSVSYLDLISEFNQAEELYRMQGGHDIHAEVNNVLIGLGFEQSDFNRKTDEFSGGWRMRIELAKILLQKPDLLLLDEPTNHLDIESIIWLENWLKKYPGAILLVSHDRTFLDIVTNRTIEIAFCKLHDYKASYSKYLDLRIDRIEKQLQAKKNQQRYIKDTQILINKFRAKKNKAAFAQTLIRKLDKLELIEVEQEDFSRMQFRFPPPPHSGKVSLRVKNITKSYADLEVLKNVNLEVAKGDKLAFVGKNGEGKTTLAKIIVGELDTEGSVVLGHNIKIGYYAQNQTDYLDEDLTVLQTIQNAVSIETSGKERDILGSFLFSNEDVDKKVKILSGGERARLALCKLLLEPINFLVMDEPTNHLDMISKDILKKALLEYEGSLILVSHDREFLQGLTERVYEFIDYNIKEYIGDIDTFLNDRSFTDFKQLESSRKEQGQKKIDKKEEKSSYQERRAKEREYRKLKNRISKLEKQIDLLEREQKKLDEQLADPVQFQQLANQKDFFEIYDRSQQKLTKMIKDWETGVKQLEQLEKHI